MDFMIGLHILKDFKGDGYNLILVMIDSVIKIFSYEVIKTSINITWQNAFIVD